MEIRDNVLKEYLKNVYFVSGTALGGKTTVTRMLGKKYGIPVFDCDDEFDRHRLTAVPELQPNMCRQFRDADEFFSRTVEEYRSWLIGSSNEQLDFVIMDLAILAKDGPVIVDCGITVDQARRLSDVSRTVFLLKEPGNIVDEYCNREDHQSFRYWIHSATDYESAKKLCSDTLTQINSEFRKEVMESEFFWLDRSQGRTAEETLAEVERHFGFVK